MESVVEPALDVQRPLRVFVCDDLERIRAIIRINLELEDFLVEEFADGRQLLRALAEPGAQLPDAVVLDAQMAGADGWWAISEIRAHPSTSALPVLLITASVQTHDRVAAERAGFDAFLAKPFDPDRLVEAVSHLARGHRAREGAHRLGG